MLCVTVLVLTTQWQILALIKGLNCNDRNGNSYTSSQTYETMHVIFGQEF